MSIYSAYTLFSSYVRWTHRLLSGYLLGLQVVGGDDNRLDLQCIHRSSYLLPGCGPTTCPHLSPKPNAVSDELGYPCGAAWKYCVLHTDSPHWSFSPGSSSLDPVSLVAR